MAFSRFVSWLFRRGLTLALAIVVGALGGYVLVSLFGFVERPGSGAFVLFCVAMSVLLWLIAGDRKYDRKKDFVWQPGPDGRY
ncbi:MAG: hypothetical protein HZA81_01615 [Candidatus Taylorbacteria bacterium]|nr:hypothetical protein [Candidatus Taylorbacteria bacterium]